MIAKPSSGPAISAPLNHAVGLIADIIAQILHNDLEMDQVRWNCESGSQALSTVRDRDFRLPSVISRPTVTWKSTQNQTRRCENDFLVQAWTRGIFFTDNQKNPLSATHVDSVWITTPLM